ncbi:MAG: hypothetical protein RLY97_596 [Pseudomonadota bacterium]
MPPSFAPYLRVISSILLGLPLPIAANAQPTDLPLTAATTDKFPDGVKVANTTQGKLYTNAAGQVLYGLDMRVLIRFAANPALYCQAECAKNWQPLLAAKDAKPNIAYPMGFGARRSAPLPGYYPQPEKAPDWTIVAGPQGPQWVYKGWHMVFVHRGDAAGKIAHDGAENQAWNTLKYLPLAPKFTAPSGVQAALFAGQYALVDRLGHPLFTGDCAPANCAVWPAFPAAMASAAMGDWSIGQDGDRAQWLYRGKKIYVLQNGDPAKLPAKATLIRP